MSQNDTPDERAADHDILKAALTAFSKDPRRNFKARERAAALAARVQPLPPADEREYAKGVVMGRLAEGIERDTANLRTPETAEPPALSALCEYFESCMPSGIDIMGGEASKQAEAIHEEMCGQLRRTLASTPPPEQASTPRAEPVRYHVPGEFDSGVSFALPPSTAPEATPEKAPTPAAPSAEPVAWAQFVNKDGRIRSFSQQTPHPETVAIAAIENETWRPLIWGDARAATPPVAPAAQRDEATAVAALRAALAEMLAIEEPNFQPYEEYKERVRLAHEAARRVLGGNPAAVSVEGLGVDAQDRGRV